MKTHEICRASALSGVTSSLPRLCLGTLFLLIGLVPSGAAQVARSGTIQRAASSIDACSLLTPNEILQALGVPVKAGVKQTTDTSSECQWDSLDESAAFGVSVSVASYDDVLYKTLAGSKHATPVSGIGETAFKGVPHPGDLIVKQGAYEIDLGIVDFRPAAARDDVAAQQFAKLVLSRL